MGESVPSLLDSGWMVSLMWQDHLNRYFRLHLELVEGSMADAYHMFHLTSASGEAIPLSSYVELGMEFLGLPVPRLDFDYPESKQGKTRLSGIVGWNLVKLAY